jgi:hypothetical protein
MTKLIEVTVTIAEEKRADFYRLVADWLKAQDAQEGRRRESITVSPSSRYYPLFRFLKRQAGERDEVTLTFDEMENALGRPFPASARRLPSWWSNTRSKTHVQAHAWLAAGWRVAEADLDREQVLFRRAGEAE